MVDEWAEMERSMDPGFSLQLVPLMAYDSVSDLRRPTAKWFIHQRLSRVLQWHGWFTCMRELILLHPTYLMSSFPALFGRMIELAVFLQRKSLR